MTMPKNKTTSEELGMTMHQQQEMTPEMTMEEQEMPLNDRLQFYGLNFTELDKDLRPEERKEWNTIYASYRGRTSLRGTIIGVDKHSVKTVNRKTGQSETAAMYCAVVVPYRVRVMIPETEMWLQGEEKPSFVLQNMVGAKVDFIVIKVDREGGFAIGSRRLASVAKHHHFARREALHSKNAVVDCHILSVGPSRCLVECYGYDIDLRQRDLRYTPIPDLREVYRPGTDLKCVIKHFDSEEGSLKISVKEATINPFDGAIDRHPEGCRRLAVIAGKYGGGVFCNLPDDTVCICNYSYQHEDSDFNIGDSVILVIQRYDMEKKQIRGKILTHWRAE